MPEPNKIHDKNDRGGLAAIEQTTPPTTFIEETEHYLSDLQYRVKCASRLTQEEQSQFEYSINKIQAFLEQGDIDEASAELQRLKHLEIQLLIPVEKPTWRYYLEAVVIGLLLAVCVRGVAVEAFRIPSGSMIPTLLVGDHIFANKLAYDFRIPLINQSVMRWGEPQPGDVIVFKFPAQTATQFQRQSRDGASCLSSDDFASDRTIIKRVIARAGDRVELRKDQLFINHRPVKQTFIRENKSGVGLYPINDIVREELPNGASYLIQNQGHPKSMEPRIVPKGTLFVLGDNRDNSSDSRCWGFVPIDHVIGQAAFIWFSIDSEGKIRYDRIGDWIR